MKKLLRTAIIILVCFSCREHSRNVERSNISLFTDSSYLPVYKFIPEPKPLKDNSPLLYQQIREKLRHLRGLDSAKQESLITEIKRGIDSLVNSHIQNKEYYLNDLYVISRYTSGKIFLYFEHLYENYERNNKDLVVDSGDLKRLGAFIRFYESSYLVKSSAFSNYSISTTQPQDYYFSNSWLSPVKFADTLLFPMNTMGERGYTIFSVWKIEGSTCRLITILDRALSDYYSSAWIENIYRLSNQKYLLVGKMTGADECKYGSVWLGIWELPRSLKVIWYNEWDDCKEINNYDDCDTTHLYKYAFRYESYEMKMVVDKIDRMSSVPNSGKEKLIRQDVETFNLDIKNLVTKNLTDEFNRQL